MAQGLMLSYL